jgi:translation elongation factor EF-Tu-like GTPase
MVVFMNKVDMVDDEAFRVVEKIRDLLSFYEYDGDNVQLFKVLL